MSDVSNVLIQQECDAVSSRFHTQVGDLETHRVRIEVSIHVSIQGISIPQL